MGQGANFLDDFLEQSSIFSNTLRRVGAELVRFTFDNADVHRNPCKQLSDTVMKFTGQSSLFIIPRLHQARGKFPQVLIGSLKFRSTLLHSIFKLLPRLAQ